jgi:hypothetical protein
MKVLGALESAQIEWFTSGTKPAPSSYPYRVIYTTDTKQILVSDGTTWLPSNITFYTSGTLPAAGPTNAYQVAFITDTFQVRVSNGTVWTTIGARLDTYTSGTIPSASANSNQLIWVSDIQQVQVSNGTAWIPVGATSGVKNYFSQNNANPNFETNSVSPWSACTLTFSGGVPSGAPTLTATQMSIATTATTPLAGTYSMQLTKAAANAQYQGFISGALTIDREDTAKVLYGSFSYEVVSGTVDFSGASTQTYEIWIYNTVSGAWTQPAGYRGMNQSSGIGKVTFSFQTDGSTANNSYKIAVITQQTGTGAIVVEFDSFQIGPSAIVLGAAMTDWQSYTPTTAGLGTISSVNMFWRRMGSDIEIMGTLTTGTVTAVEAQIGLPTGITSTSTIPTIQQAGVVVLGAATSNFRNLLIETSKTYLTVGIANAVSQLTKQLGTTFANTIVLSFQASVPVSGWSSNVQVSNDTDTRVVAMSAGTLSSTTISIGADLIFTTKTFDTHAAYNSSTGVYTVPVSGVYDVSVVLYNTSVATAIYVKKNGSPLDGSTQTALITSASTANYGAGSRLVSCNAGDTISIASNQAATATVGGNTFQVKRLSGPSVIAATESVNASYYTTSTGAMAVGTPATVVFASKNFDSHNAYNTTTGLYTAPVSGKYQVSCTITTNSVSSIHSLVVEIWKTGAASPYNRYSVSRLATVVSALVGVPNTVINLVAGETVEIRVGITSATSNFDGNAYGNNFFITRVGN